RGIATMRASIGLLSFAGVAAAFALALAGCKYSTAAGPLPGPSGAPTLPPGIVTEAPLPSANATPIGIAAGPDGNLWLAENAANKIARVLPSTMAVTEFQIPTVASQPIDVTRGPSGDPNVWFAEFAGNHIGFIVRSSGAIPEFRFTPGSSGPVGLPAAPP